jgi:hypothetical protein
MQEAILDGKKIADNLVIMPARTYQSPEIIKHPQKRKSNHEVPHSTSSFGERT